MYVAHNAFYLACILRGCDMSTGFYTNIWIWKTQKTILRERGQTDITWFSRLLRHPASKRSGSIPLTPEPARSGAVRLGT